MLNMNRIFAFVLSLAILLTPTMGLAQSVPEVMPIAESVEVTDVDYDYEMIAYNTLVLKYQDRNEFLG